MLIRLLPIIFLALIACSISATHNCSPHKAETIIDSATLQVIEFKELSEILRKSRYILIGEKHDNARHHRIQAELLRELADIQPKVVMEHIDESQAKAWTTHTSVSKPSEMAKLLNWQQSGWQDWHLFAPVFDVLRAYNLELLPGALKRSRLHRASHKGANLIFSDEEVRHYGLNQPLPDAIHRALLDDLYASHCEMVPRKHLYPTLRAQRLRDAFMARVMTSNSSHQAPVVLLAGSEHVRLDRGVPYYLQGRHRSTESPSIATVGLIELSERTSCNQPWNTPAHKDLIAKFDYIWITEAAKRKDPCEEFAEALRKIHHSASGVTKSVRP